MRIERAHHSHLDCGYVHQVISLTTQDDIPANLTVLSRVLSRVSQQLLYSHQIISGTGRRQEAGSFKPSSNTMTELQGRCTWDKDTAYETKRVYYIAVLIVGSNGPTKAQATEHLASFYFQPSGFWDQRVPDSSTDVYGSSSHRIENLLSDVLLGVGVGAKAPKIVNISKVDHFSVPSLFG